MGMAEIHITLCFSDSPLSSLLQFVTGVSLSLSFMTLTLTKNLDQLFYRWSLALGFSDVFLRVRVRSYILGKNTPEITCASQCLILGTQDVSVTVQLEHLVKVAPVIIFSHL